MRFRTKLFLAWGILVVLVYASSIWPVRNSISTSFMQVASNAFVGTKQSLHGMQAEQVARMRQACRLLMNIPELRAMIAESGAELSAEHSESLRERINSLAQVVSVQSIVILDDRANVIAQSNSSPWSSLPKLQQYLAESPQARALVTKLYSGAADVQGDQGPAPARDGIWAFGDQLYQVVGVPLVFKSGGAAGRSDVEGSLIMVTPLTDGLAMELARRHSCAVSFVIADKVIASSLSPAQRTELSTTLAGQSNVPGADFDTQLGGIVFRTSYEPLVDAASQTSVGGTLVQSSMAAAASVQTALWRNLAGIGIAGLLLVGLASFLLSAAVTRPVHSLLLGVRQVAGGNLAVSLRSAAGGEFQELARAFNDMVEQLRTRRELERQVEASRAASQAKSQFLANMSHEIRTPLNGVLGMIDILLETTLSDQQKRFAGLIKTSAKILSTVINDLLDFSKIEAGKIELEAVDFDLRLAVYEVVELLEPKAEQKGLELAGNFAEHLPAIVRGDPKRLQQILINLVNNALKFTEKGGVTIKVAPETGESSSGTIRFEVCDTGIGIPPDRMHRLFQSFSQVDASTTRKYGGTGLGLAICKQLAELMGGAIGVNSDAGRGSTFWFTIKLETSAPGALALMSAQNGPSRACDADIARRSRCRILLAEDNEINQIVSTEVLARAGYTCDVASDGSQALNLALTGKYDLVLMDCQMPVMDGLTATKAIRQQEAQGKLNLPDGRRLPIIALTANALSGDREQCLAAGMDGHCVKPLDRVHLIRQMDSLLFPDHKAVESEPPAEAVGDSLPQAAPVAPATQPEDPPIRLTSLLARCMGKSALMADVLKKFDKQSAESIERLRSHLAAADAVQFAVVAHTLKGTASLMSAGAVTRIASELERAGKDRDFATMEDQLRHLNQEVDRCRQFISQTTAAPVPI